MLNCYTLFTILLYFIDVAKFGVELSIVVIFRPCGTKKSSKCTHV